MNNTPGGGGETKLNVPNQTVIIIQSLRDGIGQDLVGFQHSLPFFPVCVCVCV